MRKLLLAVIGLAILCGNAQAQSNEQLKQMLDQALKTMDQLKGRVQQLERVRDKAKPAIAPATAPTASQWGAPVRHLFGTQVDSLPVLGAQRACAQGGLALQSGMVVRLCALRWTAAAQTTCTSVVSEQTPASAFPPAFRAAHRQQWVGTRSERTAALWQPNSTGRFRATSSGDWLAGPDPEQSATFS